MSKKSEAKRAAATTAGGAFVGASAAHTYGAIKRPYDVAGDPRGKELAKHIGPMLKHHWKAGGGMKTTAAGAVGGAVLYAAGKHKRDQQHEANQAAQPPHNGMHPNVAMKVSRHQTGSARAGIRRY